MTAPCVRSQASSLCRLAPDVLTRSVPWPSAAPQWRRARCLRVAAPLLDEEFMAEVLAHYSVAQHPPHGHSHGHTPHGAAGGGGSGGASPAAAACAAPAGGAALSTEASQHRRPAAA